MADLMDQYADVEISNVSSTNPFLTNEEMVREWFIKIYIFMKIYLWKQMHCICYIYIYIYIYIFSQASEIFSCATSDLLTKLIWLSSLFNKSRHWIWEFSLTSHSCLTSLMRPNKVKTCHFALVLNSWRWRPVRTY